MSLGMPEMMIVLVVVLLLFGPQKLPELAKGLGQAIREFKRGADGIREDVEKGLQEPQEKKL